MASLEKFTATNKAYTDLTGRFPVQSSRGNNYILVCYSYDGNTILAEPLKNRSAPEMIRVWKKVNNTLASAGIEPKISILNNEISNEYKQTLQSKNITFQLVPPHIHRRNAAERAIQTFKNHFLAGLASCNKKCPLREWDRLISQAVITLNLLRNARVNPKISVYAYVFGPFDFNKTPTRSTWYKSRCACKTHRQSDMGLSWQRWIDNWSSTRSLQVFTLLYSVNKS